jgi:UDP-N-acetylmuramate dehydrogenase
VALEREVALAPYTTFGLGGPARYFARATSERALIDALGFAQAQGLKVAILGGGSNLVVADRGFPGLVIQIALRGLEIALRGAVAELHAMAGEPWDGLVESCVARDLAGLECLSGIPGLTGATPIQNVGAYGQDVAQVIARVRVLDRRTLAVAELEPSECGFGYRTSAFKRDPERCVVLGVSFRLQLGGEPLVAYAELERALARRAEPRTLAAVRSAVLELRRGKSMLFDPQDENGRSAGSFFLNPVVTAAQAERIVELALQHGLCARAEEVPRFPAGDDRVKLAAAWLVEHAGGHKGLRSASGALGISTRHALALVHHGGGTSAELIAFARELRDRVQERFRVELTPEPVFMGFDPDFRF